MPAIQTWFVTLQMTQNIKKWSKMVSKGGPQNHQKSKIIKNPSWDLPGSIWVHPWPTWLQKGTQMVPKDLQNDQKLSSGDPKMTLKNNKIQSLDISQIDLYFSFLIDFNPGNQSFYSSQSFQSANQQTTGHQGGRRQGRSLKIRPHPAGVQGVPRGL